MSPGFAGCRVLAARGYRTARQRCLPGEGLHSSLMTANVQRSEGTVQTTQTALLLTTSQGDTKILGSELSLNLGDGLAGQAAAVMG